MPLAWMNDSATRFSGDGSELINLTGPGFNDGHSLNSLNGQFKDVVFVSNSKCWYTFDTKQTHIKKCCF